MNLFISMVLGHFVADYLFQTKQMALGKGRQTSKGWSYCLAHCVIYMLTVELFSCRFDPMFLALVFASHFFIDRWSLAETWLKMIGGRTLEGAYESKEKYREFDIAFSAIVYTVADNTLHLLLLWLIVRFI